MSFAYHVTPEENLPSIMEQGLRPSIGERSAELGETAERVYLFPSKEACEDALANWLGEQFDDGTLVILEVDITGLAMESDVGFEAACREAIEPNRVQAIFDETFLIQQRFHDMKRPEKMPPRLGVSLSIQDNAIDTILENATPEQAAQMLKALWAASAPKERFALLQTEAAQKALEAGSVYKAEDLWGYTGCESDHYESEDEALLAATEDALARLGLKPAETEQTIAKERFLALLKKLSTEGRLFHLDDSPESIISLQTNERIFTDKEADEIGSQIDEARNILGQDLMWDLAWPILNPPENGRFPDDGPLP